MVKFFKIIEKIVWIIAALTIGVPYLYQDFRKSPIVSIC